MRQLLLEQSSLLNKALKAVDNSNTHVVNVNDELCHIVILMNIRTRLTGV